MHDFVCGFDWADCGGRLLEVLAVPGSIAFP